MTAPELCTWPSCGCTARGQFCQAPVRVHTRATPPDVADLVEALREISDRHITDQPAAFGGDELEWAVRQHRALRAIARAALAALEGRQ